MGRMFELDSPQAEGNDRSGSEQYQVDNHESEHGLGQSAIGCEGRPFWLRVEVLSNESPAAACSAAVPHSYQGRPSRQKQRIKGRYCREEHRSLKKYR